MIDTNIRQDIINYMIRKNPDATIKEYLEEMTEIEKNDTLDQIKANNGSILSISEVQYNSGQVNRYKNGRKGMIDKPVIRFSGKPTVKSEPPKAEYSNPQFNEMF